jgi:hypothetical protein
MMKSLSKVWILPLQRGGTVAIALLLPSAPGLGKTCV